MTNLQEIAEEIVYVAQRMATLGLVANMGGNVSARDPETNRILITPTSFSYDSMTPDDLVEVTAEGRVVSGKHAPSVEVAVHCVVYRERPDVHGVVHTEPPYVNAFGVLNRAIPPVSINLLREIGGPVPVMPIEASGSEQFGRHMLDAMGKFPAVIWAHHGLLMVGPSVARAFDRTCFVEEGAKVYHLALEIGQPAVVSAELLGYLVG